MTGVVSMSFFKNYILFLHFHDNVDGLYSKLGLRAFFVNVILLTWIEVKNIVGFIGNQELLLK